MSISFSCRCGKHLRAREENVGKSVVCPACGQGMVIPKPKAAPGERTPEETKKNQTAAGAALVLLGLVWPLYTFSGCDSDSRAYLRTKQNSANESSEEQDQLNAKIAELKKASPGLTDEELEFNPDIALYRAQFVDTAERRSTLEKDAYKEMAFTFKFHLVIGMIFLIVGVVLVWLARRPEKKLTRREIEEMKLKDFHLGRLGDDD